jgi:acyl-CoA reductase-like NAD-dependent aldehyde dehydrogenase
VEWFAAECRRVTGDVLETVDRGKRMLTIKQPVGVVGAITPWNFPMSMITRKVSRVGVVGGWCGVVGDSKGGAGGGGA